MPCAAIEVTVNAVDAPRAVAFWTAALGYQVRHVRPPYTVLGPPEGGDATLLLVQQVPAHGDGVGSRMHLDLRVADPQAEVQRLVELGATLQGYLDETDRGGGTWWVMHDPEGTPFCICPARG
jgi:catechol 2,3-dioxygenase-like lactoylglutathione lyase family enzyme